VLRRCSSRWRLGTINKTVVDVSIKMSSKQIVKLDSVNPGYRLEQRARTTFVQEVIR
jgi:DUF4097 and DUF4098 domain-containing protein YvlB